jgi:5-methylcytosine-specific restriction endonuclease McrA
MCGKVAVNLHHVIPKSHGGSDHPDNLVPMCFACHSGHHDRNNPTTKDIINKRPGIDANKYN